MFCFRLSSSSFFFLRDHRHEIISKPHALINAAAARPGVSSQVNISHTIYIYIYIASFPLPPVFPPPFRRQLVISVEYASPCNAGGSTFTAKIKKGTPGMSALFDNEQVILVHRSVPECTGAELDQEEVRDSTCMPFLLEERPKLVLRRGNTSLCRYSGGM